VEHRDGLRPRSCVHITGGKKDLIITASTLELRRAVIDDRCVSRLARLYAP
jgi:hypothetical protein